MENNRDKKMFKCKLSTYACMNNARYSAIIKSSVRKNEISDGIEKANLILYEITSEKNKQEYASLSSKIPAGAYVVIFCNDFEFLGTDIIKTASDIRRIPESEVEFRSVFRYIKITVTKHFDSKLLENAFSTCIDLSPNLIWFKDLDGIHVNVNTSFANMLKKKKSDLIGEDHHSIWGTDPEKDKDCCCVTSEDMVISKKKAQTFLEDVKVGDEIHQFKTLKGPVFGFDKNVIGTCGIGIDLTERQKYVLEIERIANIDFLTGLFNRRFLYDIMKSKREEPFTLIYLDLNCFKFINDTYGHETGDKALILTAEVMTNLFSTDVCCRVGGDEFIVVAEGERTELEIEQMVKELQSKLNEKFIRYEDLYGLSASVGYVYVDNPSVFEIDEIISSADRMMYQKKQIYYKMIKKRT